MKTANTDKIAAALLKKIIFYRAELLKKEKISASEKRHLLRIRTALALKPRNND